MDPDLRGVVATRDRTVVDEGHFAAKPGGGNGCAHACDSSSDHHEIVFPAIGRLGRKRSDRTAEGLKISNFRRRNGPLILCQPDGVATPVKACHVRQRKLAGSCLELRAPGILPEPGVVLRAENSLERFPLQLDFKGSGALFGGGPGRGPVVGANPDMVHSRLRNINRRTGVGDWFAHAVGDQVRRAHEVHELLVQRPAAFVGEGFGLDEYAAGREIL